MPRVRALLLALLVAPPMAVGLGAQAIPLVPGRPVRATLAVVYTVI